VKRGTSQVGDFFFTDGGLGTNRNTDGSRNGELGTGQSYGVCKMGKMDICGRIGLKYDLHRDSMDLSCVCFLA